MIDQFSMRSQFHLSPLDFAWTLKKKKKKKKGGGGGGGGGERIKKNPGCHINSTAVSLYKIMHTLIMLLLHELLPLSRLRLCYNNHATTAPKAVGRD